MTQILSALVLALAASASVGQHRYQMDSGRSDGFVAVGVPACHLNEYVSTGSWISTLNAAFRARHGTVVELCLWVGAPGGPHAASLTRRAKVQMTSQRGDAGYEVPIEPIWIPPSQTFYVGVYAPDSRKGNWIYGFASVDRSHDWRMSWTSLGPPEDLSRAERLGMPGVYLIRAW